MSGSYRLATPDDYDALGEVMFEAVWANPSPYTDAERKAWVTAPRKGADWVTRLSGQHIVVYEEPGRIAGFMSLVPDTGYVDFAYTLASARGRGVFRELYSRIEIRARDHGCSRLTTHASLSAHPAFLAVGFIVLREEVVEIGDQHLRRFEMAKPLTA